ncbi:MmgE/PrpD family protein [Marinibaculum pumilum]|uniref:MmgE/PrpD family protein n=1 Tax=Marinibaculum pumilum TaxID=1766165 RepID=A0ABV7KVW8_9PROT
MNGPASGPSRRLAEFACASTPDDLPEAVRAHALRAVVNGFGTALGGAADTALASLARALMPFSAAPQASVIGTRLRADMPTAAFLNAAAINVFDFDDNHAGTIIHPTAPVLPAALALAESRPVSGAALIHAVALGMEAACRIGNAVSPGHYARGWHITSTCGVFGAAIAAARLLGLDAERTLWALGNASAQAAGLVETLGHMAKSVSVGGAARNGLLSALMAEAGVAGPAHPLEGPRGFLSVCCDAPRPEAVTEGLGIRWELLDDMFKPYPCGVVLNPVIDACLEARADPVFDTARIARIAIRGNPLLKARTDRPGVTTGREAQVSAQHAVAVSLLRGTAGVADFADAAVQDPAVRALAALVSEIGTDEAMPVGAAGLSIGITDGSAIEIFVPLGRGYPGRPMSDEELMAKFAALARHGAPAVAAEPLAAALWQLPGADSIETALTLARPGPGA